MLKKSAKKKLCLFLSALFVCLALCSCTWQDGMDDSYAVFNTTDAYFTYEPDAVNASEDTIPLFAENLCVGGLVNSTDSLATGDNAATEAVFTLDDGEVAFAKNIYERRYPASTTKILTCYLALKYGDPDQVITVSDNAIDSLEPGGSLANLAAGYQLTLRDALYGLMLASGNDAANAIAEAVAGSIPAFVDLMNSEAKALGCTQSHFTNVHGMPDDEHYTTAYDLYLIFQEAIQIPEFVEIISTDRYTGTITSADGYTILEDWENTNGYLTGEFEVPEGVRVIGGKTGTTDAAGACLVLYSENASGAPVVSIVLDATDHDALYECMTELLSVFAN